MLSLAVPGEYKTNLALFSLLELTLHLRNKIHMASARQNKRAEQAIADAKKCHAAAVKWYVFVSSFFFAFISFVFAARFSSIIVGTCCRTKTTFTRWKPDWEKAAQNYREAVKHWNKAGKEGRKGLIETLKASAEAHLKLGSVHTGPECVALLECNPIARLAHPLSLYVLLLKILAAKNLEDAARWSKEEGAGGHELCELYTVSLPASTSHTRCNHTVHVLPLS